MYFHIQWGSYQLVKHDRLWCLIGWAAHFSKKMEVVDCFMPKSQYGYKQASISIPVNPGPQTLTTSVLMALFKALGNVCYS